MNNALDIRPGSVYRRVQLETRDVYAEVGRSLFDNRTLHVHLDQARGGDLVVKQPVGIHQEVLLILIETGGDLSADTLGPSVQIEQSEDSRQFAPQQFLALGVSHTLYAANVIDGQDAIGICVSSNEGHRETKREGKEELPEVTSKRSGSSYELLNTLPLNRAPCAPIMSEICCKRPEGPAPSFICVSIMRSSSSRKIREFIIISTLFLLSISLMSYESDPPV